MNLDDLMCRAACHDLLMALTYRLDNGEYASAAELFWPDAVVYPPTGGEIRGDEVAGYFLGRPAPIVTRHIVTNLLVTPTGPSSASATGYLMVYRVPRGNPDVTPRALPATPQSLGDWNIELTKVGDDWKISRYGSTVAMVPAAP